MDLSHSVNGEAVHICRAHSISRAGS